MIDVVTIGTQQFIGVLKQGERKISAPRAALMNAVIALDQDVRNTFRTETDPWGQPWPALSPATLRQRLRAGHTSTSMLNVTSKLFRSLKRGVETNLRAYVSIGEGAEDRFAEVHQWGNPNNTMFGHPAPIPARPMFPVRTRDERGDLPAEWAKRMMQPLDDLVSKAFT